jgi:predicted Zn-dependent peptidase
VLQLETSQGLIMFGLRREVLESRTTDPEEILAEIEKVTVDDVQRVARDLIENHGLNLAVIGPFEDAARFEQLLA